MKQLLVQYEKGHYSDTKWYQVVALDSKGLQHGGTFRNTLGKHIDELLTLLLAGILAQVDRHSNLNLVTSYATSCERAVYKLWLAFFCSEEICPLHLEEIEAGQLSDNAKYSDTSFQCKLPFFWMIKKSVTILQEKFKGEL